jgi:hypothetical protein
MTKQDEYRRNAALAQRSADKAKTDEDRAAWLRVVEGWLSLLRTKPGLGSDQQKFENTAQAHGTGQEPSDRTH